jgi:hypothetical protein
VTKQFDKATKQRSLLFQIEYPEIEDGVAPRHRFMSAFEQKVEAWDKKYQYLLFAAEPYEVISFKVGGVRLEADGFSRKDDLRVTQEGVFEISESPRTTILLLATRALR